MNSRLTIGTKILASIALLLILMLIIGVAGLTGTGAMQQRFAKAVDKTVMKIRLADTINTAESDMVAAQRLMIIGSALKNNGVETGARAFRTNLELSRRSLQLFQPLLTTDEGKALVSELATKYSEWEPGFAELERAAQSGNTGEADRIRARKTAPVYMAIEKAANRMTALQMELLETDKRDTANEYSRIRWIIYSLLGLSILTGAVVVVIVRRINRELQRAANELEHGTVQVASAAAQVSASSQSLAQGASQQAASLEETSSSSEEINSMARRNGETARSAADLVGSAQKKFADTNDFLDQMVAAMEEINQSSEKVSKIIKVIDEVAFQTNILALNAAVEAARAGDAGMGFAVVADEVRSLAQRCSQAAKETSSLIEDSVSQSRQGKAKLDLVANSIRSITEDAGKIKALVDQVNLASQQQSRGFEQVAQALTQMDKVTQEVASNAEESASASEELNAQSTTLKAVAERLTLMVGRG